MKKRLSYLVLLLLLLCSSFLQAEIKHYAGISFNAGEWSLLPRNTVAADTILYQPSVGAAGSLGFQYEMQYKPHAYSPAALLFDVGLNVKGGWTNFNKSYTMSDSIVNCPDFDKENIVIDETTGKPIIRDDLSNTFNYYYLLQNRDDHYFNLGIQVPLMVGVQYKRFYGLAGVKVNYNLKNWNRTTGLLTTFGKFPDFEIDQEQHNVPPYQLFDNIEKKMSLDSLKQPISVSSFSIDASIELGLRLGYVSNETGFDIPKRKIEYRLAAFADFGLLNWRQNTSVDSLSRIMLPWPNEYKKDVNGTRDNLPLMVKDPLNDVLAVNSVFGSKFVHNLFVGLKFTVLFQLPNPGECLICRDSYHSTAKLGRRGRGVKYEEE